MKAQNRAQPKSEFRTTPEDAAYCFKTAFEIGRDAKSEQEIRAAIPENGSEVIRTKILVWACIYYCLTEGKPELYNNIKADFHELVSEFEYWCENLLVAVEESKPSSDAFSLAEIKELGFNINSETVQTIREFRRLAFGRKLTIN